MGFRGAVQRHLGPFGSILGAFWELFEEHFGTNLGSLDHHLGTICKIASCLGGDVARFREDSGWLGEILHLFVVIVSTFVGRGAFECTYGHSAQFGDLS